LLTGDEGALDGDGYLYSSSGGRAASATRWARSFGRRRWGDSAPPFGQVAPGNLAAVSKPIERTTTRRPASKASRPASKASSKPTTRAGSKPAKTSARARSAATRQADVAERPPRGRKLGEVLAERVEEEIIASGWPVGKVLGSEAELIERYGVSRAVFREAMRIVDHHGVAEMRRGPGGGLVVVAPKADAAVRTLSLNLEYLDLTPEQINEARLAIELNCVRAAVANLDDERRRRIQAFVDNELDMILSGRESGRPRDDYATNDFHLLIADLTDNPAMRLFVDILSRVTSRHSERASSLEDTAHDVHRVHSRIAEAIIAGDVEAAERRMKRHLDSVVHFLHP
jgi:DNA-binding FadR family transcriptional regulator